MELKSTKRKETQPLGSVRTISDLMENIDTEIAAIKTGELSEQKARIIAKNRMMQLNSFQVVLQAARIEAQFRPELVRRMGLPSVDGRMISQKPQ
jgi:hypothetical protein